MKTNLRNTLEQVQRVKQEERIVTDMAFCYDRKRERMKTNLRNMLE